MFRQRLPDHSLALPYSSPLCELSVSALNALSRETTPTRHCSPNAQIASVHRRFFSVTSKRLISQPFYLNLLQTPIGAFAASQESTPGSASPPISPLESDVWHTPPYNPSESHLYKIGGKVGRWGYPPFPRSEESRRNIQVLPLSVSVFENARRNALTEFKE